MHDMKYGIKDSWNVNLSWWPPVVLVPGMRSCAQDESQQGYPGR